MRIILILLLSVSTISVCSQTVQKKYTVDDLLEQIKREPADTTKVKLYIEVGNELGNIEGINYIDTALILSQKNDWQYGISEAYFSKAWLYLIKGCKEDALENFLDATKYKGNISTIVHSYGLISNIYLSLQDIDRAMIYANHSFTLAMSQDSCKSARGNAYIYLADIYREKGDLKNLASNMQAAYDNYLADNNILGMSIPVLFLFNSDIHFDYLTFAFKIQEGYDNATINDRRFYTLSLFKLVNSYVKLKNEEQQREKYVLIVISILFFLLVISGFLLWQNYLRKKMNARLQILNDSLDKENQLKASILGILNHDLRRPVARLINYLELKRESPDSISPEIAVVMENQTLDMTRSLLQNMEELLIWSKGQLNNRGIEITEICVESLFRTVKIFFDYEKQVQIDYSDTRGTTLWTDEACIEIIMRNLTANAIHATRELAHPKIVWSVSTVKDQTILSIWDNGKGISDDEVGRMFNHSQTLRMNKGFGVHIISDLAAKIGCQIKVSSTLGEGTEIKIIFESNLKHA